MKAAKTLPALLAIALSLPAAGCGTCVTAVMKPIRPQPYSGVRADLAAPGKRELGDGKIGMACLAAVDLPFSFLADTCFYLADAVHRR